MIAADIALYFSDINFKLNKVHKFLTILYFSYRYCRRIVSFSLNKNEKRNPIKKYNHCIIL